MGSDTVATPDLEPDAEIMAAIEEGPTERFVVADVSTDEAYVTTPLAEAASLPAWR